MQRFAGICYTSHCRLIFKDVCGLSNHEIIKANSVLIAYKENVRGMCVNEVDMQAVLWSHALWVHRTILALPW